MGNFYIFLWLTMICSSLSDDLSKACRTTARWSDPICTDDQTGYYKQKCIGDSVLLKSGPRRGYWGYIFKKDTEKKTKECPAHHKCFCDDKYCVEENMCHDMRIEKPVFPKYGVLAFKATASEKVLGDEYQKTTYTKSWAEKVAINERGFYYRERPSMNWDSWKREAKFTLILPSGDGFIKYTGWLKRKTCKKETVTKGYKGFLFYSNEIPKRFQRARLTYKGQRDGRYIREWHKKLLDDPPEREFGTYEEGTFTYVYDTLKRPAIPLRFRYVNEWDRPTMGRGKTTVTKDFTYKEKAEEAMFDPLSYGCGRNNVMGQKTSGNRIETSLLKWWKWWGTRIEDFRRSI